ncbi:MAG: hypothetical protein ACTHJ6_15610 [Oryzihumus sp.]
MTTARRSVLTSSTPPAQGVGVPGSGIPIRSHLPFLIALLGGVVLRVVVSFAYHPAIIATDSYAYLDVHLGRMRPFGYSLLLWPLRELAPHTVAPIPVAQHLLGLGLAVGCYVFLVRRGLPGWGATLAVLPVLYDPLQLVLEHYVMSDVVFEALLVAGCLLVLWRPRPLVWAVALAGLAVGSSALVRGAGTFLVVVFVVALLCLRVGWVKVVVFVVGAAVPVAAYAAAYHAKWGVYATSQGGPLFLYGQLAPIVRCHDPQLHLPPYEKVLCPARPVSERPDSEYYTWEMKPDAVSRVHPPRGMTQLQAVSDFDKRVIRAQPRVFASQTFVALVEGFSPVRTTQAAGHDARSWLFQDHYWRSTAAGHPTADPGLASFMTSYRKVLWTPGPLLAGLLLVAGAAILGVGRARRSGDRVAIGLLAGTCVLTLLTCAALSGFSWRYQLPQLTLLPMAGALAVAVLVRGAAPGRPAPLPPLNLLERASRWLVRRRPGPARADERGALTPLLAGAAGLVTAVAVAAVAVVSGWFRADTGAVVGLIAGLTVAVVLLVAHRGASSSARDAEATHSSGPPVGSR